MSDYKVLIPLDGSRLAEHALAYLPALSYLGRLDVTLLSVVDFTDNLLQPMATEEAEREQNLLSTYLREIVADLEKHLGAVARYEVVAGHASDTILETASRLSPDLLVISTHGRTGIVRWQRGAVADKVIRNAGCPVLAVGPRAMEQGQWLEAETVRPFKQILVPLDGSEVAEASLPTAKQLTTHYDSHMHVLQVLPYVPLAVGFTAAPHEITEHAFDSGRTYLADVTKRAELDKTTSQQVAIGSPVSQIAEYVEAHDIDLIVMTSHGRSGLTRAALGSVTDRVIGLGPPVLVVRSSA